MRVRKAKREKELDAKKCRDIVKRIGEGMGGLGAHGIYDHMFGVATFTNLSNSQLLCEALRDARALVFGRRK